MAGYVKGSGKTGRKNMRQVEPGVWENEHGVKFTTAERRAIKRAEAKSNLLREKQIAELGPPTERKTQLQLMGKQEHEFILTHQNKPLQKFRSREQFENYMDKQSAIHSGEYQIEKARLYKRNFINSLLDVYGPEAKDIAMKVRMMDPMEYMKMVDKDEVLEISYVDSKSKTPGRLQQLRNHLGMKLKDEWADEELPLE